MNSKLAELQRKWDDRINEPRATLKSGGGGGTFDGMEVVDAKIAASEARTDTKFAQVIGKLDTMNAEMNHMPSTWAMVGTMGAFTALAMTVILAVLAYGGQMFGVGMDAQQVSERAVEAAVKANAPQIQAIERQTGEVTAEVRAVLEMLKAAEIFNDVTKPPAQQQQQPK